MEKQIYRHPLVNLREVSGTTQKQVADAVGVSEHTVRNWEKGRSEAELQIWQVKALCRILKCSLEDLPDRFKPAEN
ncbi:helix-turn-helix transcriptional regulator [Anabaena azotica]|uniref:helix-turn-helix transcriptional regulator n=1 Tax=Anabaena azotica TaxID=197653 RepID=UPI0039A56C46